MCYQIFRYIILLICLVKNACFENVSSLVLIKNIENNSYYCLTNSTFAMTWISEEGAELQVVSKYIPNTSEDDYNYNISKKPEVYNLTSSGSFKTGRSLILDQRWEEMEIFGPKSEILFQKIYDFNGHRTDFSLPLSIRSAQTVNLFLCDASPPDSNCYWFLLHKFLNNSTVTKFKKHSFSLDTFLQQYKNISVNNSLITEFSKYPYHLSSKYWSHFILKRTGNTFTFNHTNGELSDTIFETKDENIIKLRYVFFHNLFSSSFLKVHRAQYLYTSKSEQIDVDPPITPINGVICVTFFLQMCDSCTLNVMLSKNSSIIFQKTYAANLAIKDLSWLEIRLLSENLEEGPYKLLFSTRASSSKHHFWKIDRVRRCHKNELRVITSKNNVPCQLMSSSNTLSINDNPVFKIKDSCENEASGEFCISTEWLFNKSPRGIICPRRDTDKENCFSLDVVSMKTESKDQNKCKNHTSNCKCAPLCDKYFTGKKCEREIQLVKEYYVYSKTADKIFLRWQPTTPSKPRSKHFTTFYRISWKAWNQSNYLFTSFQSSCQKWPGFLCATLNNLTNNTNYQISIREYEETSYNDINGGKIDGGPTLTFNVNTKKERSNSPYDIRARWEKGNNLTLSWKHPNETNGDILHFKIELTFLTGQNFTLYKHLEPKTFNLTYRKQISSKYITPSTYYKFVISAYNGLDGGRISIANTTPPEIPALEKATMAHISNNNIVVVVFIKKPQNTEDYSLSLAITENEPTTSQIYRIVFECKITEFDQPLHLVIGDGSQPKYCNQNRKNSKINTRINQKIEIMLQNTFKTKKRFRTFTLLCCTQQSSKHIILTVSVVVLICMLTILSGLLYWKRHSLCSKFRSVEYNCLSRMPASAENDADFVVSYSRSRGRSPKMSEEYDYFIATPNGIPMKEFRTYVKAFKDTGVMEQQHMNILNTVKDNENHIYESTKGSHYFDFIDVIFDNATVFPKAYIVSETITTAETMNNFWKMIWEENVQYIIFHSREKKFYQYWPSKNAEVCCNGITIQLSLQKTFEHYDHRKFVLISGNEAKQVDQIHNKYNGMNPKKFVPLLRRMQNIPFSSSSPILVHSSDGLDFSGFILLCDITLRTTKVHNAININRNMERLASYNMALVANAVLFKFAYLVISEYLAEEDLNEETGLD